MVCFLWFIPLTLDIGAKGPSWQKLLPVLKVWARRNRTGDWKPSFSRWCELEKTTWRRHAETQKTQVIWLKIHGWVVDNGWEWSWCWSIFAAWKAPLLTLCNTIDDLSSLSVPDCHQHPWNWICVHSLWLYVYGIRLKTILRNLERLSYCGIQFPGSASSYWQRNGRCFPLKDVHSTTMHHWNLCFPSVSIHFSIMLNNFFGFAGMLTDTWFRS